MERLTFVRESGEPLALVDDASCPVLTLYEADTAATTKQYGGWWVVRSPRPPLVQVDGLETRYVPLERVNAPDTYRLPKEVRDLGPTAGLLRFYASDEGEYVPLEPPLYVQPSSLTDEEYDQLLRRIGQIAVAVESAYKAPIRQSATVGKGNATADARLRPALVYLELFETVKQQWPLIESRPAKALCHEARDVDVRRGVRSAAAVRALVRRPERRTVRTLASAETTRTVENEMVAYVLESVLIGRAQAIRDYLEELSASEKHWDIPKAFQSSQNTKVQPAQSQLDSLGADIQNAQDWATRRRRSPLLRGIPATPPRTLTARMTRSSEYGSVYHAFQTYEREQVPSLRAEPHGVIKALREHAVRKSSDLYELWVLFEVYAQLVLSFGFRVPKTARSLFDQTRLHDRHLYVRSGAVFDLEWKAADARGPSIRVRLTYDAFRSVPGSPGDKLRPDIWIEITVNNGRPVCFAIDPKYRTYADISDEYTRSMLRGAQRPEELGCDPYLVDLLHTADEKYRTTLGATAAFVVHSDRTHGGTWPEDASYWGDRPCIELDPGKRLQGERRRRAKEFVDHSVGSIYATPGSQAPNSRGPSTGGRDPHGYEVIERLLRCILVYHVGREHPDLRKVCWTCRSRVTPLDVDNRGIGNAYLCCGRFWIVTHCTGAQHTLIKYGSDSFHRTEIGDAWHCHCPACGGTLSEEVSKLPPAPEARKKCPRCRGTGRLPYQPDNGRCWGEFWKGLGCDDGYVVRRR